MKKIMLVIAAVAMLSLVSSSAVHAEGFAPGEGLYVGAFVGGGFGTVSPKVKTDGGITGGCIRTTVATTGICVEGGNQGGTFEASKGGLGLAGIEGGGSMGYGYKMGDLYAGIEGEMATGDVTFKVKSDTNVILAGSHNNSATLKYITEVSATKDWTGGLFGRLGYYVNPDTLLAFRGGVLISKFDVTTKGDVNYQEDFFGGGPSFGASLESRVTAIDPNLSVRIGAVYTDFLTASVFGLGTNTAANDSAGGGYAGGHDSEVTGSAISARLGVQYSFFDVNSLF